MKIKQWEGKSKDRIIAFISGALVTGCLLLLTWREVVEQEREVFEFESGQLKEYIADSVNSCNAVSQSLQAFFHASQHVDADQFSIFLEEVFSRYPFIDAVRYAPHISLQERPAFEEEQRYWGWITFLVFEHDVEGRKKPVERRESYYPILYSEPFVVEDTSIIGYDILSDSRFQQYFEDAIETGKPVPTGPVPRVEGGTLGYELLIAIYEGKGYLAGHEERKKKVNGLIYLTINPEAMIPKGGLPPELVAELCIVDKGEGNEKRLLYRLQQDIKSSLSGKPIVTLSTERVIHNQDQHLVLTIHKPLYFAKLDMLIVWLALASSLVIFISLNLILSGRRNLKLELKERRHAQLELAKHLDQLEYLVDERTRELTVTKEKAEAATRAKSEFLANMSHEIRTPLNAVTGFSELLSSLVTDPKQKNYLEAIKTAGRNLLILINDILDLSKIEAEMLELAYWPVNPRMIVREIEQIFRAKVDDKCIEFTIEIDERLPKILIMDEIRVRQILLNLIGNAVKFTEQGYIKLSIRVEDLDEGKNRLDLVFAVDDSGIGMSEEDVEGIFEPFKQHDVHDTKKYGGTGLGLAICRRLVEAMDGEIKVSSLKGEGSTFVVVLKNVDYLPAEACEEMEGAVADTQRVVFQKSHVLVVDDIPSNRHLLMEMLTQLNLEVETAVNGQEALLVLAAGSFDLVIMDIRMPVMDGLEANARIKADRSIRNIPIIALTASAKAEDKDRVLREGFDSYMTKPFRMKDLVQELCRFLPYTSQKPDEQLQHTITTDDIRVSGELATLLREKMIPRCLSLKKVTLLDEVARFGSTLRELGAENNVESLVSFGNELNYSVQVFDIVKIKEQLRQFPELVRQITR